MTVVQPAQPARWRVEPLDADRRDGFAEAQGRFLLSGTAELFEDHGFTRVRQVRLQAWILGRVVEPSDQA